MLLKKAFLFFSLVFSLFLPLSPIMKAYCEADKDFENAEPYAEDEFPQWSKDLRRAEIVSLGAIPFAAISVTMAYGSYQYASGKTDKFPNPLSRDNGYSKEEIFKLVGASAGIGLTVGITDFAINYAKRKNAEKARLLEEAKQKENIKKISPEEAGNLLRKNTEKNSED